MGGSAEVEAWEPSQQSREGDTLSLVVPARYANAARRRVQEFYLRAPQAVTLEVPRFGFFFAFPEGYLESAAPGFAEIVDEMCALRTPQVGALCIEASVRHGPCPPLKAVRGSRGLKFHASMVASNVSTTAEGVGGSTVRCVFEEHYTGVALTVRCAVNYAAAERPGFPRLRVVPADHIGRWFEYIYETRQLDPSGHHLEIELWLEPSK